MEQWILTSINSTVLVLEESKHARVLTKDDEDQLWGSGVLCTKTPKAVQKWYFL